MHFKRKEVKTVMKRKNLVFSLLSLTLIIGFQDAVAQKTLQSGTIVRNAEITRRRDSVKVNMRIDISGTDIKSGSSIILHPRFTSLTGTGSAYLLPVEIMGRTRKIYLERNPESAYTSDEMYATMVKKRKSGKDSAADGVSELDYTVTLPYSDWMDNSRLSITEDLCGCGKVDPAGTTTLYDADISFHPQLAYIVPEAEPVKTRALSGESFLDFRVNRTEIDPSYRKNPVELQRIISSVDTVKNDKDFTITSIEICGYASPEGTYSNNTRLAEGRTESLKEYLMDRYGFPSGTIKASSVPENWDGLKEYISSSSELPNRGEILSLLKSLPTDGKELDRLERSLRADYPAAYSILLKDCYPGLRRTNYRIDYVIRSFKLEEARELIWKAPQRLSLQEMFAVAQTYTPGSEEFKKVFDVAVRMYPDDETANINVANALLEQGNAEEALKYLDKVSSFSPEAENARGVAYLLLKDYEKAEKHIGNALSKGDIDSARHNMEFLR